MQENRAMLNLGIFAHVDAGKTTLTERMLFHSRAIRTLGSVDKGTAHTDTLPIERARGISVRAAAIAFEHGGRQITLIDTPGHADFSFEVERSLWALDAAMLVVSAVEGVQAQTELIFEALSSKHVPALIFINKTDRIGADIDAVLKQLRRMTGKPCPLANSDELVDEVCASDDALMEQYLSGTYNKSQLRERLREMVTACEIYPVYTGSALKNIGVTEIMDAAAELLPGPCGDNASELSGVVFGFMMDKAMGRAAICRIFDGTIAVRSEINGQKITQIKLLRASGWEDSTSASAGQIAAIFGVSEMRMGQTIGVKPPRTLGMGRMRQPLIMVELQTDAKDMPALRSAVRDMERDDPLLDADWSQYLQKLHVMAMGGMQLDVMKEELAARGLNVNFGPPQVMYRETIASETYGFVAYTMPKPCWAVIKLKMEPLPRGSGVEFYSIVPDRQIKMRYQHQIEQALSVALKQGVLGWPVTDIKLTLIDGNDHQWHTHPLDFVLATPMAVMDGLQRCGTTLLEPIQRVRFTLPSSALGGLIGDVAAMRGSIESTRTMDDLVSVVALIPASTSMSYGDKFAQLTGGRGVMVAQLDSYRECELTNGASCPRRSVNPLDTSKYILAARSALDGGVWDGGGW